MTTIIAKKNEDGTVDIAWDSQSTAGNRISSANKLTTHNNQLHVGVGGWARFGDIVHFSDLDAAHPAEFEADDFDPQEYLVRHAVPTWIKALREAEHIHKDKEDWADGSALIVMKGRIFNMDSSFSINEVLEYGGIGSGSGYATGALAHGASVLEALEIAAELDPFTGGVLNEMKGV